MRGLGHLKKLVGKFTDLHLIVVGDVFIDEYAEGVASRLSPEAPVPLIINPVLRRALGGAGNAARNVASMGARCTLHAVIGTDESGCIVDELARRDGIDVRLADDVNRATGRKIRIVANGQQLARIDHEAAGAVPPEIREVVLAAVESTLIQADGLIADDYSKGLMHPELAGKLVEAADRANKPFVVDPKRSLGGYSCATIFKPNAAEALELTGEDNLAAAIFTLRSLLDSGVAITNGPAGMMVLELDGDEAVCVPTRRQAVRDVQGAGDTAMAAMALAKCTGATLVEAAVIANAAAGVVIAKPGTATVTQGELLEALPLAVRAYEER